MIAATSGNRRIYANHAITGATTNLYVKTDAETKCVAGRNFGADFVARLDHNECVPRLVVLAGQRCRIGMWRKDVSYMLADSGSIALIVHVGLIVSDRPDFRSPESVGLLVVFFAVSIVQILIVRRTDMPRQEDLVTA